MTQFEELKELPRFLRGKIEIEGLIIEYHDPLALYHEYNNIFTQKIYHFDSSNDSPFIIDAGGYIGLSTLYFKTVYPNSKIIVFEPDPDIFRLLETNISANKFENISAINAGVGKNEETIQFFPNGADGGSKFPTKDGDSTAVNTVKLSNHINGPIDLLKMNIEGMEGEVFEEIEHKLNYIREIIFEYHAFHDYPQQLGQILSLLNLKGFRYLITDVPCAKTKVPFKMNQNYKNFNLVYAKNTGGGFNGL